VAERVRTACIEAAVRAYQQAGIAGLCHEGRFEVALSALQMLDIDNLVDDESQVIQTDP
jgi:hypothetical protein